MNFKSTFLILALSLLSSAVAFGQTSKVYTYNQWCGNGGVHRIKAPQGAYVNKVLVTLTQANGDRNFMRLRLDGKDAALMVVPHVGNRHIDPTYPVMVNEHVNEIGLFCEGENAAYLKEVQVFYSQDVLENDLSEYDHFDRPLSRRSSRTTATLARQLIREITVLQRTVTSIDEFKFNLLPLKIMAARLNGVSRVRSDVSRRTYARALNVLDELKRIEDFLYQLQEREAAFEIVTRIFIIQETLIELFD